MFNQKKHSNSLLSLLLVGAAALFMTVPSAMAAYFVQPDAYWQLEDSNPAAGITADLGGVNGTCDDAANDCPSSGTGRIGAGFTFDGTDDAVDFADNPVFDFGVGASFSIEMWIKRDGLPADVAGTEIEEAFIGRVTAANPFGNPAWVIGLDLEGRVAADAWDGDGGPHDSIAFSGYTNVTDDQWHHVALVHDAGEDKLMLYVDGVLEYAFDTTGSALFDGSFDSTAPVTLGELNSTLNFDGSLDNVAIYSSEALSASVVAQNYLNGMSGRDLDEEFAPSFIGSGSDTIKIGMNATLNAKAAGNPMPDYTSTDLPDHANLSAAGDITWIPGNDQTGDSNFNVTATNSQCSADQSWAVTVEDPCTSALDAHWKLEESDPAAGVMDDTGTIDGTCSGNECPGSDSSGKVENGYAFDGDNDAVVFADNEVFDFLGGSFSIEMWVKRDGQPTDDDTIVIDEAFIGRVTSGGTFSTNPAWVIGLDKDGRVSADAWDGDGGPHASNVFSGFTDVTDNQWHHVALVRDAGNSKLMLYVDGMLEGALDTTGSAAFDGSFDTAVNVTLGELNGGLNFGGSLDEVAIYNTDLSAAMVAQHFNADAGRYYCNGAPSIDSTAVTAATEDVLYTYAPTASDPENDTLTWTLTAAPSDVIDVDNDFNTTNGQIDWTPAEGVASVNVTLEVSDAYNATATQQFTITVAPVNDAPVITGQESLSTPEGTALTITLDDLNVTDSDNTYPADFTLAVQDGSNYTRNGAEITPVAGFSGTLTVPVSVNDGQADSNVYNLEVTVTAVNEDPEITSSAPTTATVGTAYAYAPTATDADNDTLTWSLSGAPSGLDVDANTGAVTWTPADGSEGDVTFTLTVSDGNGGSDSESITVTVSAASDPQPQPSNGGGGGGGGGCFISAMGF